MLNESKRKAVVDSFRLVVPIAETAADLFYGRLFELRPEYRQLFTSDMGRQKTKLVKMLAFIVKALDYRDSQWSETVEENNDLFYVVLALDGVTSSCTRCPRTPTAPSGRRCCGRWTRDSAMPSPPRCARPGRTSTVPS